MAGTQTCAVCGKPMDPKQRGNFHIKTVHLTKVTMSSKHAHATCVQGEPAKARSEGF